MDALFATVRTTGMVMLIVISAQILSAALTFSGVSRGISELIYNSGLSKWNSSPHWSCFTLCSAASSKVSR